MADVDLVEAEQLLAVVERGRRPWCGAAVAPRPAATARQQVAATAPARNRTSTPALRPGSGSTPITGCPSRYLATLATRPSCPTATTMSSGREQEPGQVVAVDVAAPPVGRDAAPTVVSAACRASCRAVDLVEVAAALAQEVAGRGAGAVPAEQLVELAAAADTTTTRGRERPLIGEPSAEPGQQVR